MRALLTLAALLVLAGPAQARDDTDAASRCAVHAARLDKPLGDLSTRSAFRFWNIYIERYEPIPFDAAAVTRKLVAQCGDDDLREGAWAFTIHMLAASGDLDGALAAAEERLRLSPSDTAWKALAEVRLRRGDEAGALAALRHGTPPLTPPLTPGDADDAVGLARLYDSLAVERDSTPPAALAVLQAGERSWRAVVQARPTPENTIRLASMISRQGVPLERMGDYKAAAAVYARVEAELAPLRAAPLDGFDERGVQAVLRRAYVYHTRASARAGDRAAMLDSAGKALSLAQDDPVAFADDGTLRGAISIDRWGVDPSSRFPADEYRLVGDDLLRAGAAREALPVLRAVSDFWAAVAQARGKPYDGVHLISVAKAQRLAGQPGASLKTIDDGLALMRAEAPRRTPVPIDRYMQPQIAEGLLEKGLALDALARGAEACAAFREARVTFSPEPTHHPVTSPLLTQLDEAVARPACAV